MPHINRKFYKSQPTSDPQAGLNLVEILIALAIFSIGVAQVMAMFPTAVYSAAENVRSVQARALSRSAIAELEIGLRAPQLRGVVSSAGYDAYYPGDYIITMAGEEESEPDEWAGYYITIKSMNPQTIRIETSVYDENRGELVFVLADEPDGDPGDNDRFVITRFGLPPLDILRLPRGGTIESVSSMDGERNVITADEDDDFILWHGDDDVNEGSFFMIFTTGRATNRPLLITDISVVDGEITCDSEVDFIALGVAAGDRFVIVGAPDSESYEQPTPHFGNPGNNRIQTFQPRTTRVVNDQPRADIGDMPGSLAYTYAAIISNTHHPDYPDEHMVRVDIFVFHGFNQALPPERNRRATLHHVHYIGRR